MDSENQKFYIRILADLSTSNIEFDSLIKKLSKLNSRLKGKLAFHNPNKKINVAILGTKETEPIYDLLIKNKSGDLKCNIPLIISNHNDLEIISKQFNKSYYKVDDENELLNIFINNNFSFMNP